jgi:hypothetical protein
MAAVRAGLGPTLPALLRRRFGIPPLLTLAVAVLAAAIAAVAVVYVLTRPPGRGDQVVHESPPVFNLLRPPDAMRQVRPHRGELMRLEGRRGGLIVEVVVRPLELPPYEGDVTHGLLPVYANRFVEARRAVTPGFELVSEGRARVNNAVGYEIGFQALRPEDRLYGRDVLLVPDDPAEGRGLVTLSLRQHKPGGAKFTPAERGLAFTARKAYRSFRFGTKRG